MIVVVGIGGVGIGGEGNDKCLQRNNANTSTSNDKVDSINYNFIQ